MSTLTPTERAQIRHHLGYLNVQQAATFVLGVPAAVPTSFILESAFDKIILEAEPLIRRYVAILDALEAQEVEDAELLAVMDVDEIKIRPDEHEKLWLVYRKWQGALANLLGVIPNPFDQRFAAAAIVNVPVSHGG